MIAETIAFHKSHRLLDRWFWQPHGVLPALSGFEPDALGIHGRMTEVTRHLKPTPEDGHRLVVVELAGGKLIGDGLVVATADDVAIEDLQSLRGCSDSEAKRRLRRTRFRIPRHVPGSAVLVASNGGDYHEWCFDSLPRWHLLYEADWDAERADHVILNQQPRRFQAETLGILGVPREKWLRCSKWEVLQFDRLVVASMPAPSPNRVPLWARDYLRRTFLPEGTATAQEDIYISRRQNRRRRLANEADQEDALRRLGFRICRLESMAFRDQVNLFAAARVIVAPQGAGLANLVFSPPGTRLIELLHPQNSSDCYENLSAVCGLAYQPIVGRATDAAPARNGKSDEFTVNVEEVLEAVSAVAAGSNH